MSDIRIRSKGTFFNAAQCSLKGINYAGCGTTTDNIVTPFSPCKVGTLVTMADTSTPNFRKRQAKGEFIFNGLSVTTRTSELNMEGSGCVRTTHPLSPPQCPDGSREVVQWNGPWFPYWVNGSVAGLPIAVGSPLMSNQKILDLCTEVSTKVLAERGMASSNLFEDLAEIKQTLRLFKGPIKAFHSFFNKNGRKMALMGPAEAWLTYKYGIKPLINSIQTVAGGLKLPVGLRRQTSRSSLNYREQNVSTSTFSHDASCTTTVQTLTTDEVSIRAMAIDEHFASVGSNIGFTAKGLITLPWELLPYSFVADWFITFGDYLKAISPAPGYKSIGGCLVQERTIRTTHTAISSVPVGAFHLLRPDTGICSGTLKTKLRGDLSAPGILFRSDFHFSSLDRVATALALIKVTADRYFRH